MSIRKLLLCSFLLVASSVVWADVPRVHLKYVSFDPLEGEPQMPARIRLVTASGEQEPFLMQFDGPVEQAWKDAVATLGLEIGDYIPDYCFVVQMTPEQADAVRAMAHVRWVGAYHPAYRIAPDLLKATGKVRANIITFPGRSAERAASEARGLGTVHGTRTRKFAARIDATVPARDLAKLARVRDVAWIEPRFERTLHNDIARGTMTVPTVWAGVGLYGSGEIVGICDTGLDTGDVSTLAADFAGRIVSTYALGRSGDWSDGFATTAPASNPSGHGTHVAGSVLGSGVLSGSNPATQDYGSSRGAACFPVRDGQQWQPWGHTVGPQ